MVLEQKHPHRMGETQQGFIMTILPYKLSTTKDCLTSRAGLVLLVELMEALKLPECIDKHFPLPKSNRGFKASVFIQSLLLMHHEGGGCLDDIKQLRHDQALRQLLRTKTIPTADAMGNWLRRYGKNQVGLQGVTEINKKLLSHSLKGNKAVTLDIDATLSASQHKTAEWTYKKCTGYMPMVGHIAETGQVVSTDFRAGNVAPATENFEFIQQCETALPEGVKIAKLRSDSAGYQAKIIDYCIDNKVTFAIRAKLHASLKKQIVALPESDWTLYKEDESTTQIVHTMEKSHHAFMLIIQRKRIKGQLELDLNIAEKTDEVTDGVYIYRAIATNSQQTEADLISWYNQRAEASENRIKELKNDFGAGRMPCRDFHASALYFSLCALSYNLFAFMRQLLPNHSKKQRIKAFRLRVYAIAGKVVKHGRQTVLKLQSSHHKQLATLRSLFMQAAQAP